MKEPEEHKVVLTPRTQPKAGGPGLWIALICVPLMLGLVLSMARDGDPAEIAKPAVYKPVEARIGRGGAPVSNWVADVAMQENEVKSPEYACDFTPWIGQKVSEDMLSAIKGAQRPYRTLPPGSAMTMDHNPARINFDLDNAGVITRVWCG